MLALAAIFCITSANAQEPVAAVDQSNILPFVKLAKVADGGIGDLLLGSLYDVRADVPERLNIQYWENFLEIQNTTNRWVACHLRFRSFRKSIEVWDKIILLSPYDVFWSYLTEPATGGVRIASSDWATLANSGLISQDKSTWVGEWSELFDTSLLEANGYTENLQQELEYGEIEVIGLWALKEFPDKPAYHTLAGIGVEDTYKEDGFGLNVYDILYDQWCGTAGDTVTGSFSDSPQRPWIYGGTERCRINADYGLLYDCPNVLKGSLELGDTVTGQYNLYNLFALKNFRTDLCVYHPRDREDGDNFFDEVGTIETFQLGAFLHRDLYCGGAIVYPIAALRENSQRCYLPTNFTFLDKAWHLNPDNATSAGATLRDGNSLIPFIHFPDVMPGDITGWLAWWVGELSESFNAPWSLWTVELALAKLDAWTFYLNGDTFNNNMPLVTDVNVAFPTKYLHYNWEDFPSWPTHGVFGSCGQYITAVNGFRDGVKSAWDKIYNGPIEVQGRIFDVDQNWVVFPPGSSPYVEPIPVLPHEVNIVRVGDPDDILDTDYGMGQIWFDTWQQLYPGRNVPDYYLDGKALTADSLIGSLIEAHLNIPDSFISNLLPMIGITTRIHSVGGIAVYRSATAPHQYVPLFDIFDRITW